MNEELQIEVYKHENGTFPFIEWKEKLSLQGRSIITARLGRLRKGNFGDCKPVKGKGAKAYMSLEFILAWI